MDTHRLGVQNDFLDRSKNGRSREKQGENAGCEIQAPQHTTNATKRLERREPPPAGGTT